mmetsp:Transcript_1940/g.12182  ORF Transcript_1940/g.12182 Transcript_1940/m.12182 type:complete len:368 (+) Transcript_1940:4459-5562(+)
MPTRFPHVSYASSTASAGVKRVVSSTSRIHRAPSGTLHGTRPCKHCPMDAQASQPSGTRLRDSSFDGTFGACGTIRVRFGAFPSSSSSRFRFCCSFRRLARASCSRATASPPPSAMETSARRPRRCVSRVPGPFWAWACPQFTSEHIHQTRKQQDPCCAVEWQRSGSQNQPWHQPDEDACWQTRGSAHDPQNACQWDCGADVPGRNGTNPHGSPTKDNAASTCGRCRGKNEWTCLGPRPERSDGPVPRAKCQPIPTDTSCTGPSHLICLHSEASSEGKTDGNDPPPDLPQIHSHKDGRSGPQKCAPHAGVHASRKVPCPMQASPRSSIAAYAAAVQADNPSSQHHNLPRVLAFQVLPRHRLSCPLQS